MRAHRLASGLEPGLSDTQLAALAALETHEVMTPGELAEHEKVQPPSMTRVIAVLEERGLVIRSPHASDRRQVVLRATEQGKDVVCEVGSGTCLVHLATGPALPLPNRASIPRDTSRIDEIVHERAEAELRDLDEGR